MVSLTIINNALRLISIIRTGQTAASTEIAEGLTALNDLVDSWSTMRLDIIYEAIASYAITAGTALYTIGSGGTLTGAVRPNRIEAATFNIPTPGGSGLQEYQMVVAKRPQWTGIKEKGATSLVSQVLYYDRAFPLGNVRLWPVPSGTGTTLTLYTWSTLTAWPDLVTDVPIATGYSQALQFGLAIALAGRFNVAVPDAVQKNYDLAIAGLRSLEADNEEPPANTPAGAKT